MKKPTSRVRLLLYLNCLGLLVILSQMLSAQSGSASAMLEDFTSVRMNHDIPASPLFQPYTGSWSQGPGQTGSIQPGGFFRDNVPTGQAPYFEFIPYPYNTATGFVKGNLRSGAWSASINRMSFWMRVNGGSGIIPNKGGGAQTVSVGTYSKTADSEPGNQGDHYYHFLYANWYPGQWMLVTLNRTPQHQVGQGSGINWKENPTRWTGNPTYKSPGWDYFDGLTRFYLEPEYANLAAWGGRSYDFADYEFTTIAGEPDQLVASVTATYTGSKYELSWQGPKNTVQSYTVYYAPVSMHANGLAAGTKGATASTPGNDYAGVIWASPAIARAQGGMYFAIAPAGQANFTEIYLPDGPYQGKTLSGQTSLAPPSNLRIVP